MRSRNIFRRFVTLIQRLQWKLTLSYVLVTAIAIVIMQIILLSHAAYFSDELAPALAFYMHTRSDQATDYLDQSPRNLDELSVWLQQIDENERGTENSNITKEEEEEPNRMTGGLLLGEVMMTSVTDREGRVLAVDPPNTIPQGSYLQTFLEPTEVDVLQTALDAETNRSLRNNYEVLSARTGIGRQAAAVPLLSDTDGMQGVWFVRSDQTTPAGVQTVANFTFEVIPQVAQIAVVFAIIVGALFGFITARGLTRRLRNLVNAASAWGEGDFSVVARDNSGDEVGQLANQLNRMAEELKMLLQMKQELATVDERNRLARELHDSVKQQLFATGMQVGAARALLARNDPSADERLAEAERLAHSAQQELKMIINELRPAALENKGLAAALRDFTQEWSRHSGIEAHITYQGERELPLTLEQALFRVSQEALANVARHSDASRVDVRVTWTQHTVTLRIIDDGQGFHADTSLRNNGVGLKSMRERLEPLAGNLVVESAPGHGTSLIVQINY